MNGGFDTCNRFRKGGMGLGEERRKEGWEGEGWKCMRGRLDIIEKSRCSSWVCDSWDHIG